MKKKIILMLSIFFIGINLVSAKETVKFSDCVDGDTIKVLVGKEEKTIRMLAVDTPESVHPTKGIEYYGNEENKTIFVPEFIINHYPDESKDRSLYRKLLEDAVELYPKDPYYGIYLGIELARRYSKEDSTEAFRRALNECDFTNSKDLEYQMCINLASMTTFDEAITVLNRASKIGYKTRRLYKVYADAYESIGDSDNAIAYLEAALTEVRSYSNDWTDDYYLFTGYIEDKLSLFYYYQKNDPLKSFEYCVKALEKDKDNERLRNNLKFYYESFLEKSGN